MEPVNPNISPVPNKPSTPVTLSFPDAIAKVIEGRRISRIDWHAADYGLLKDGLLEIFTTSDNQFHIWKINDGDLLATDWIVLPDITGAN